MIQLANDPSASRMDWQPAAAEPAKGPSLEVRRRGGHAWPFIVRPADRPAAQVGEQPPRPADSGS